MPEQNTQSTDTSSEKVPLEKQGHLTRTQLYILLAILSLAILGLCGYIVWDNYNTEPVVTKTVYKESTVTEEDEDGDGPEVTQDEGDETSDGEEDTDNEWITHSEAGFSFQHPSSWIVQECDSNCAIYIATESDPDEPPFLSIYERDSSELTIDDYINDREAIGETVTELTLTISARSAWKITPENPETEGVVYLVVERSSTYLELQGNPGEEGSSALDTFEEIVNTLEFPLNSEL